MVLKNTKNIILLWFFTLLFSHNDCIFASEDSILHSDGFVNIVITGKVIDQVSGLPVIGTEVFDITGQSNEIWAATRCNDASGEFRLNASIGFASKTHYQKQTIHEDLYICPFYLLIWKTGYAPLMIMIPESRPKTRDEVPDTIVLHEIRIVPLELLEKRISTFKNKQIPKQETRE